MNMQNLPQVITAIGGLGTAAFGLVDATKALGGGVNHIGFGGIKTMIRSLTPGDPVNALSQGKILATLQANWFNGTDLGSQKAIAKSLIKLNLNSANADALAKATGVDSVTLTAIATNIATSKPLDTGQSDVYARFDLILTALLDETYQRADNVYRNWTRAIAGIVAIALAVVGNATTTSPLHTSTAVLVGLIATPLAPVAKDLSSALATAVNTLQLVKKLGHPMTRFLDVRLNSVGGDLATTVAVSQGSSLANYQSYDLLQLRSDIRGRNVLIATHGYKVNRQDGIACLANWEGLLQLAPPSIFLGLLWPGDSVWGHGLDYPLEPRVADDAGQLVAPFIDANFAGAASVSFASHSLGARVILQTILKMNLPVRRVTLMAGAIDDNCLITEFQGAAAKVQSISILASYKDDVLSALFPLGNFVGGILAAGHPWWHAALGHCGPADPKPANFQAPFQIPDGWSFGHHNYLQVDPPPSPAIALPADVPDASSPFPGAGAAGWQEAWSAAFCSTRFR